MIGVPIAAAAIVVVDQHPRSFGFEFAGGQRPPGNVPSLDDSGPPQGEFVLRRDPREVLVGRQQGQFVTHAQLRDERSHRRYGDSTTTTRISDIRGTDMIGTLRRHQGKCGNRSTI